MAHPIKLQPVTFEDGIWVPTANTHPITLPENNEHKWMLGRGDLLGVRDNRLSRKQVALSKLPTQDKPLATFGGVNATTISYPPGSAPVELARGKPTPIENNAVIILIPGEHAYQVTYGPSKPLVGKKRPHSSTTTTTTTTSTTMAPPSGTGASDGLGESANDEQPRNKSQKTNESQGAGPFEVIADESPMSLPDLPLARPKQPDPAQPPVAPPATTKTGSKAKPNGKGRKKTPSLTRAKFLSLRSFHDRAKALSDAFPKHLGRKGIAKAWRDSGIDEEDITTSTGDLAETMFLANGRQVPWIAQDDSDDGNFSDRYHYNTDSYEAAGGDFSGDDDDDDSFYGSGSGSDSNTGARNPSKPQTKPKSGKKNGDSSKPVCKYGAKCYRKNPAHFEEYAHPHLDNKAGSDNLEAKPNSQVAPVKPPKIVTTSASLDVPAGDPVKPASTPAAPTTTTTTTKTTTTSATTSATNATALASPSSKAQISPAGKTSTPVRGIPSRSRAAEVEAHSPAGAKAGPLDISMAHTRGTHTLVFPSFSTSTFQFDADIAADVLVSVVEDFLTDSKSGADPRVRLVLIDSSPDSTILKKVSTRWAKAINEDLTALTPDIQARFITKAGDLTDPKATTGIAARFIANAANWRLSSKGGGTNAALHKADPTLDAATKLVATVAQVAAPIRVPLASASPLRAKGVSTVFHVVGPNMNPNRPNCLNGDYAKGREILQKAYYQLFRMFYKAAEEAPTQAPVLSGTSSGSVSTPSSGDLNTNGPKASGLPGACYRCGKTGHWSNSCPLPDTRPQGGFDRWSDKLRWYITKPSYQPQNVKHRDADTVTVEDEYPKGLQHLLIMPTAMIDGIADLEAAHVPIVTRMMARAADAIKEIRVHHPRMHFRVGFHAVPSMRHLHMHVVSSDLNGKNMKDKKHWNSFTARGYWLPATAVLKELQTHGKIQVDRAAASALLKNDLVCYRCGSPCRNMPILKKHQDDCPVPLSSSGLPA